MTEHVHEWEIDFISVDGQMLFVASCAVDDCPQPYFDQREINYRLNATERLSAKVARRNGVILRLGADRVSYGKQTQGYGDSLDLMAYADILEGKDD